MTDGCALQVYRREPRSAYRPSLPRPRPASATRHSVRRALTAVALRSRRSRSPRPRPPSSRRSRSRARSTARCRASRRARRRRSRCAARSAARQPGAGARRAQRQRPGAPATARPRRSAGPLGHGTTSASALQFGTCASLAFDATRAAARRLQRPARADAAADRPRRRSTTIATLMLPLRTSGDRTDLAGGTHFIVRARRHAAGPDQQRDADHGRRRRRARCARPARSTCAGVLASGERPFAVARRLRRARLGGRQPGHGRHRAARAAARRGRWPCASRSPRTSRPTRPARTSSRRDALYRLRAGADGDAARRLAPAAARRGWRTPAPGASTPARGRRRRSSAGGYVAVADGAEPAARSPSCGSRGRDSRRLACAVPVFRPGTGSIEAHLVVAGRSIVATNAYGYDNLATTEGGRHDDRRDRPRRRRQARLPRRPGRATRSRRRRSRSSHARPACSTRWSSRAGFPDAWNLAALDWRTGERCASPRSPARASATTARAARSSWARTARRTPGTFGGVVRFADAPASAATR